MRVRVCFQVLRDGVCEVFPNRRKQYPSFVVIFQTQNLLDTVQHPQIRNVESFYTWALKPYSVRNKKTVGI